ncbi:MAG: hypothetical protein RLZ51_2083 [Pseudomonadota bacterium]
MNVKRYTGKTTRDAMSLLREELGSDALILANRPCPEGVEILATTADATSKLTLGATLQPMSPGEAPGFVFAAVKSPAHERSSSLEAAEQQPGVSSRSAARDALGGADLAPMSTVSFQDYVRQRLRERRPDAAAPAVSGPDRARQPLSASPSVVTSPPIAAQPSAAQSVTARPKAAQSMTARSADEESAKALSASAAAPSHAALLQELQALKGMISNQFDAMRWFDDVARDPMQARLLRQMMEGGFSLGLARAVVGRLPQRLSEAQGTAWLATVLARNLRCVQAQDGFDAGGVFALVGPTGVGKTTTTAKIAARHLLRNGPGSVALITVDTYRMGAHDQLRAFGKILNVPVHVAHDAAALLDLLRLRRERQLVLIDTVGMSQRDDRIVDLLDMLPCSQVHRVMVASAAAQPESIEESLQAFRSSAARGLVLTKLDEASRLGGALDCVIRARLPLMGVCDGQRVPEDWQAPDASRMIRRALQARVPQAFSLGDQSLATAMGVAASKMAEPVHA